MSLIRRCWTARSLGLERYLRKRYREYAVQKDFSGTSVTRVISIVGEDDWVGRLFRGGDPFTGVDHQYRIVLKGVDHVEYGYNPAAPSEEGVKSAMFIAQIAAHYNDDAWLTEKLGKYPQVGGSFKVDVDQFLRENPPQ